MDIVDFNKILEFYGRFKNAIIFLNFLGILFTTFDFKSFYISNDNDINKLYDYILYAIQTSLLILNSIFIFMKILLKSNWNNKINGNKKLTLDEYAAITKETTKIERQKLFSNPKFIEMINKKGNDERKWNWQLLSRINGKMNIISDDELSNITISDEE